MQSPTNKITELQMCKKTIRKWLHIDDEEWIDVVMACALDRKVKGDPLWLFTIAVPSGTKTEVLRALKGNDFVHISSLTTNSFVTGYRIQEAKGKTGRKITDLASQIDGRLLILKDFTSILAMAKDKRDDIIGQLRELYDGEYTKKFGNIDKIVEIDSSFGLIAGVTPKIDQFNSIMNSLGERFLKIRGDNDSDEMLTMCDINEGKEQQMRTEITKAMTKWYNSCGDGIVTLNDKDKTMIKEYAKFLAQMRAPSYQRWQGDDTVEYIPAKPEKPARVYKQLLKLTRCLCILYGLKTPNEYVMKCVERVARDSSPPDRIKIYEAFEKLLKEDKTSVGLWEVINESGIPKTTTKRILQLFREVGLIEGNYLGQETAEYWLKNYKLGVDSGLPNPQNAHRVIPNIVTEEEVVS